MFSMKVDNYAFKLKNAVLYKEGCVISKLFQFNGQQFSKQELNNPDIVSVVNRHLLMLSPWDEIALAHMKSVSALTNNDFEQAYSCQMSIVLNISRIFSEQREENWMLPAVQTVAVDLRRFAYILDFPPSALVNARSGASGGQQQQGRGGKRRVGEHLEQAAQMIMKLFQTCASDSRSQLEDSKKLGMMGLCNQLLKIYFQINKLNLCKPMIRAIDMMPIQDRFSLAQRVTYGYYVGRKEMFDGRFPKADKLLSFAFEHCQIGNKHNKRLILIYLIPVKMLLGTMPIQRVLIKYNLMEFSGIVEAVQQGNLRQLNVELEKHETFFISCGIYLILEKLKNITCRNLFKKVHGILNTHQLPVDAFTAALKVMGVDDIDQDETHCILANLISEGRIKGYIAQQQQKLVVSKKDAFPPLLNVG